MHYGLALLQAQTVCCSTQSESVPCRGKGDCPGKAVWELLAAFNWDRPVCEAWCGGVVIVEGEGLGIEEKDIEWMVCPDAEKAVGTGDAGGDSGDSRREASISKPKTKRHKDCNKCF